MTSPEESPARPTRWLMFHSVGLVGFGVQLVTIVVLTEWMRCHYLVSTAIAVEIAILHNFAWHHRWTWRDRRSPDPHTLWPRLVRFNLVNGTWAIVGQLAFTGLYAEALGLHYAVANILAIASCSLVSFSLNDSLVFRAPRARQRPGAPMTAAMIIGGALLSHNVAAAELKPQTVAAWSVYVEATEQRIATEQTSDQGFLGSDFGDHAERARRSVRRGDIPVVKMKTTDGTGSTFDIPKGAIHHWRGSVFVPGVSLDELLRVVQRPASDGELPHDVLASRVLERRPNGSTLYLKLRRRKFVTVHYNSEHDVQFERHDPRRASSRSVATRIAELTDVGTPHEMERPPGDDRGFLWRLNSYWRYEEVAGGVFVECESVSLSRSVPAAVRWMVSPLIRQAAQESMERTLTSLRARVLAALASTADD